MLKTFELKDGHEIRGEMIRLYPDAETDLKLRALEGTARSLWNWLVKQTEDVLEARTALAVRDGLVGPRPPRPVLEGLSPDESKSKAATFRQQCLDWHGAIHKATKDHPGCQFRKFKDLLDQHECKHDYQLLKRVMGWWADERVVDPGAHMLQSLSKNYFQKSARRKKFRKRQDAMPLQTRSGACFELGDFGTRRGRPFYDCQVRFNGLKIKGRLPGRTPSGRVLEGVSITRRADGWWASIKQEVAVRVPSPAVPGSVIGIDVGLDLVAAFSDGTRVPNERARQFAERIAGRQALGLDTGRLHQQAAKNAKHVLYNKVVKPLAAVEVIKIEKLAATIGHMGSSKMSSMRLVRELLTQRYGDRVREVDCRYTSQDCSQCGHRSKETWSYEHGRRGYCPSCRYTEDRDVNAARNIAARPPISLVAGAT